MEANNMEAKKETKNLLIEAKNEKRYGDPFLKSIAEHDFISAVDYSLFKLTGEDIHREEILSLACDGIAILLCILSVILDVIGVCKGLWILSWPFIIAGIILSIDARIDRVWRHTYQNNIMERSFNRTMFEKMLREKAGKVKESK